MRRIILALLSFVLVAVACVTDLPADPTTTTTTPDAGPQLITERWLRRGLDLHSIQTLDEPIAQFIFDEHVEVLGSGLAHDWDRNPTGWILARPQHIVGTPFKYHRSSSAVPPTPLATGSVTETDCRNLTGRRGGYYRRLFDCLRIRPASPIEHEINDTTTRIRSPKPTVLTQSLELETGESFEAGVELRCRPQLRRRSDFTPAVRAEQLRASPNPMTRSSEHSVKDLISRSIAIRLMDFVDTLNSAAGRHAI